MPNIAIVLVVFFHCKLWQYSTKLYYILKLYHTFWIHHLRVVCKLYLNNAYGKSTTIIYAVTKVFWLFRDTFNLVHCSVVHLDSYYFFIKTRLSIKYILLVFYKSHIPITCFFCQSLFVIRSCNVSLLFSPSFIINL